MRLTKKLDELFFIDNDIILNIDLNKKLVDMILLRPIK